MPESMRAWRIPEPGATGAWAGIPVPTPKMNEALLKMRAAGICRTDLEMRRARDHALHRRQRVRRRDRHRRPRVVRAQLLRLKTPATIMAVDMPERLAHAEQRSAHLTIASNEQTVEAITEATGGAGVHVVIDFVGTDATLAMAAKVTRSMGCVRVVGTGGGSPPLQLHGKPARRELQHAAQLHPCRTGGRAPA
jgi:threonine dehydrogenase-like Zn-dependent dehydrogenase